MIVPLVLLPEDRRLGDATRWIFFHGALVWTAIVFAVVTAAVGLRVLLAGAGSRTAEGWRALVAARHWRSFSLTVVLWAVSLALSFPIMSMTWGGVLWREPRLLMSFLVTTTYLLAWAAAFVLERRRFTLAVSVATGLLTVVMVATVTSSFHPDSPVFSSGNPAFIGGFLLILAGILAVEGALVFGRVLR